MGWLYKGGEILSMKEERERKAVAFARCTPHSQLGAGYRLSLFHDGVGVLGEKRIYSPLSPHHTVRFPLKYVQPLSTYWYILQK